MADYKAMYLAAMDAMGNDKGGEKPPRRKTKVS